MELYLDQFGSLLSGPDSVGDVVVKLHPPSVTGLRSVSLLDLEDEGATIDPVLPTPAATVGPSPAPVEVVTKVASLAVATSIVQPSEILEGVVSEDAGAVATAACKDRMGAEAVLMGDDTRDDGQHRFDELGRVILPRPIDFQGPDIDP